MPTKDVPSEEIPSADIVVVGKLGSPYGVRGWLHLQSFTTPAKNLLTYQPWFIQAPHSDVWRSLPQPECRPHKNSFVAKLEGVSDRDVAGNTTGSLIGVSPEVFPPTDVSDEIYWRDLVGCTVVSENGVRLGEIEYLLETGAHDVMVITRDESSPGRNAQEESARDQLLIPFAAEYVIEVDVKTSTVTVNWDPQW